MNLLKKYQADYEKFMHIKDSIFLNNNLRIINYSCKICDTKNHQTTMCNLVHYFPSKELIIRKYNYSCHKQDRELNDRKKKRIKYEKFISILD